jgi:hypothetical protein
MNGKPTTTQDKPIKAKAWEWSILLGAAYVDAEHDKMDGPPDEGLLTTTIGNASMSQKGWNHSPLKGEWTHLDGEGAYA